MEGILDWRWSKHERDVIMSTMASQMTRLTIVCSAVYSDADQRKHQSPASLDFVRGIHRWPVNSSHKGPATRKMFPFDDIIMMASSSYGGNLSIRVHMRWPCMFDGSLCNSSMTKLSIGSNSWRYFALIMYYQVTDISHFASFGVSFWRHLHAINTRNHCKPHTLCIETVSNFVVVRC